jgi:hypothetical protein
MHIRISAAASIAGAGFTSSNAVVFCFLVVGALSILLRERNETYYKVGPNLSAIAAFNNHESTLIAGKAAK